MLGADALHDATIEVLKAIRTYHHAYRAAFRYPTGARLAELKVHASLLDVARMFLEAPFKRYPVMRDNLLVGQISRSDILRALEKLA